MQRGSVLSSAMPLLVLPCASAVAEVCQLETDRKGELWHALRPAMLSAPAPVPSPPLMVRSLCKRARTACTHRLSAGISDVACFLRDVGLVVPYLARHQLAAAGNRTPQYHAALRRRIAIIARGVVATAASRGWAALAALLLPAADADADADGDGGGAALAPAPLADAAGAVASKAAQGRLPTAAVRSSPPAVGTPIKSSPAPQASK